MRLSEKFSQLGSEGAFIAYLCAGDPTYEKSLEAVESVIQAGADVIELGLPFSDPIADGPTIQKASQRALSSGMNTRRYFEFAAQVHGLADIPLVCMTYYNLLLRWGLRRFVESCVESGITALIIPDLPYEEACELEALCRKNQVDLIYIVAETTDEERLDEILSRAGGFLYVVSVLGTTGARKNISPTLKKLLEKLKAETQIPLAVGFGVSTPQHVSDILCLGADAVIVGSGLIDQYQKKRGGLFEYAKSLKQATYKP
ncbi:MAG: tryptophan synthase subunit alpha [Candidatus Altiarchaeales archaeon]|nr:tryptophan synthase subunit alpha [Candidatus Altiarchaeales archaeon]